MNVSSFMGLQTALRGLLAQQRGLDVTAHNLANANTVGYTRQEAALVASTPLSLSAGALSSGAGAFLGTGVEVEAYRRLRDTFLDVQYRGQAMTLAGHETTARSLSGIEAGLNEPGDGGIAALLGQFWSAWGDVANYPESQPARQALIGRADALATAVRTLDARLSSVAAEATAEYATITGPSGPIVAAATEIQRLNVMIESAVKAGRAPNDLLDRRDVLLDELSGYAQVSVTDLGGGLIRVSFGDAVQPLVDGTNPPNWPQALTAPGGRLGALIELGPRTTGYRAQLGDFARELVASVNAIHSPPAFFTATAGAEATDVAVAVTASTIRPGSTAAPGASDLARQIAALRGKLADQRYADLVGTIGADAASTNRQLETSQALVDAADARRQEVSGVAMDEEVTNMIRFQRGYQASSRAMTTVDEMLDALINRTGRVGL
ncbi:MAG TPA: flagellar basal body rod C-terminal domain-containing protein [Solirubrobacteraceae bacterium]|nr:flagellar basal body rod C-terminal domain-containing protein [Solirubrobacteraceae bacterium]